MGTRCSVCLHPEMAAINAAILRGDSERSVAKQYKCSDSAVHRHQPHIAKLFAKREAKQARTLHGDAEEALAIVREVARALELTPEQAESMSVMQGLQSGYYEMRLKVADRLLKNAELVHGTKAKVTTAVDPRQEWAALAPSEKRDRLAEMKHRLLELEQETIGGQH